MYMGAWGTGIFSSDTSLDVKGDYLDALKAGRTDQEAEKYAIRNESDVVNYEDDCALWTALAMIQWQYGRLSDKVKNRAIQIIDNGGDYSLFENANKAKREKALLECKQTLLSPMPARKNVKVEKPCRISPWKMGDIFAYQISDKNPQNETFFGKYFVFIISNVKHHSRPFKELEFDEVTGVVLNKVFDNIPAVSELIGIGYLHFYNAPFLEHANVDQTHRNYAIPLSWLKERPIKKFMAQTTPIGNDDNISPMVANIYSQKTALENMENTLVEVYQNKELNGAV